MAFNTSNISKSVKNFNNRKPLSKKQLAQRFGNPVTVDEYERNSRYGNPMTVEEYEKSRNANPFSSRENDSWNNFVQSAFGKPWNTATGIVQPHGYFNRQQGPTVETHPYVYEPSKIETKWTPGNRTYNNSGRGPITSQGRVGSASMATEYGGRPKTPSLSELEQQIADLTERAKAAMDRAWTIDRNMDPMGASAAREEFRSLDAQIKELEKQRDQMAAANNSWMQPQKPADEKRTGNRPGMLEPGNIDLNNRKVVNNPDGSISTERSFSVNIDGQEVLLPTVIDGRIVTEDEAIDHYYRTGEHLGKFDTPENANNYANWLHQKQGAKYGNMLDPDLAAEAEEIAIGAPMQINPAKAMTPAMEKEQEIAALQAEYDQLQGRHQELYRSRQTDEMMAVEDRMYQIQEELEKKEKELAALQRDEQLRGSRIVQDTKGKANVTVGENGQMKIGGGTQEMDPYSIYEGTAADKRGQEAENQLRLENYKGYSDRHYLDQFDIIGEKEAWQTVKEQTEANVPEYKKSLEDLMNNPELPQYLDPTTNRWLQEHPDFLTFPEDYEERKEYYDRLMYEFMGRPYDLDEPEDREAFLEKMWQPFKDGSVEYAASLQGMYDKTRGAYAEQAALGRIADRKLKEINTAENRALEYEGLIDQNDDDLTDTEFHSEYDRGESRPQILLDEVSTRTQTTDIHRIYSFINGGIEQETWLDTFAKDGDPRVMPDYRYSMLMTEDEVNIFRNLYNKAVKEGKEPTEAKAFLDALQPYLRSRYSNAEKIDFAENARKYPVLASIESLWYDLLSPVMDVVTRGAHALGDKNAEDPNSGYYYGQRQKEATLQTIEKDLTENVGAIAGKAYTNFMNSASNFLRAVTGPKGEGLKNTILSLGQFFLQVDQEARARYLADNMEYGEASARSAADGAFEVLEELLPFETMLKSGDKNLGIAMLAQSAVEMLQEFTGATVFEKFRGFMFGDDQEQERADEIIGKKGYYNNKGEWVDLSELSSIDLAEYAKAKAKKENWDQAIEQGLGGFFGGWLGGAYGTTIRTVQTIQSGRKVTNAQNTYDGTTGGDKLTSMALKMEGTKSKEIAEEIAEKRKKGKGTSNYTWGKLATTVAEESQAQVGEAATGALENRIRGQLKGAGLSQDQARNIAGAMTNGLMNGKLTRKERGIIAESADAIELWRSYNAANLEGLQQRAAAQAEIEAATAEPAETLRSVANLMGSEAATATEAASRDVNAANAAANSAEEAVDKFVARRPDIMSDSFAEAAKAEAKNAKTGQKTFLDDAVKIRLAAFGMNQSMPKTNMSQESAQRLWEAAQKEVQAAEATRVKNQARITPGKGTASFEGAQYGSAEWNQATSRLDKNVRRQVNAIAWIVKQTGNTVNFKNMDAKMVDEEGKPIAGDVFAHGWESNSDGSVTINVAGLLRSGARKNMMATIAHELTHWLEQNSTEGYAALRNFLLKNLRGKGMNIEQRLVDLIDNQNSVLGPDNKNRLDLNKAMAEIVAQSCEELMTSREMITRLAGEEPGAYEKVAGFIRKLWNSITSNMTDSLSEEAKLLRDVKDDIAKYWLSARDEALGREAAPAAEANESFDEEGGVQYSIVITQHDQETLEENKYIVSNMEPVITLNGDEFTLDDPKHKKTVQARYEQMKGTFSRELGWVVLNKKGVNDSYAHGIGRLKALLYAAVPEVLRDGYMIEYTANWKKRGNDSAILASKIRIIGGEFAGTYYVGAIANLFSDGHNNYYTHEGITAIANEKGDVVLSAGPTRSDRSNASLLENILKELYKYNGKSGENYKNEVKERNKTYDEAIKNNDVKEQQRLVDETAERALSKSKVRGKDGKLLKVYHGTSADFTVFRRDVIGSTGRFEGSGFNFTPYEGRASSYGKNVLAGYLNIQNPLSAKNKTISLNKLARIIKLADPTGDNIIADYAKNTNDYGSASFVERESVTAARSIWESSESDVDIYSFISAADPDAEGLIREFNSLGYDGLIHYDNDGNIKTAVAFSSEQFKLADPATYDNKGNVIPLSKRFNKNDQDIRYSVMLPANTKTLAKADPASLTDEQLDSVIDYYKRNADYKSQLPYYTERMARGVTIMGKTDTELDAEYAYAVRSGNEEKALEMIRQKMSQDKRIVMFDFNAAYKGNDHKIAKQLKISERDAVQFAAAKMARHVPKNAVLVPMPNHRGVVTDTGDLAAELSRRTGAQVIYALGGEERMSMYEAKDKGKAMKPADLKMREVQKIPAGMVPVVIDNVVASGTSAKAAQEALGQQTITLAYAWGEKTKKHTAGLKDIHITYDANLKSAENPDGLIPLSMRGNYENPDIRYSVEQLDREYMAAVKSRDTETAQKMVDAAAKKNGYTKKVYHGTPTGGFTVFHGWSYFTENEAYANRYRHASASSIRESYETGTPQTYELYMNPGKVFDTRKAKEAKLYNEARMEYGMGELSETDSGLPDWTNGRDLIDFLEERGLDYDTILLDEGADGGYGEEVVKRGISYLTKSNNVKSAETVTYDDSGNVIPLSERFNAEEDDIRYSVAQPDMDVRSFMLGLNEASLSTYQEKAALRQFKEANQAREIAMMALTEQQRKLKNLQAIPNPTAFDKKEMTEARNRITNAEKKIERAEESMARMTGEKGFARLMMQQENVMRKLVGGRTASEVRATIEALTEDVKRITFEMEVRERSLKEMRESMAGIKQTNMVDQTSARKMASIIRKEYQSSIGVKELAEAITTIRLKIAAGQNIDQDVEDLAWRIAAGSKGEKSVYLSMLQGRTIVLGKGQMAELRATNSNLREVRSALAGTGIKVKTGDTGTLDSDWNELCDMIPALNRDTTEKDQLDEFLRMVRNEKAGQTNQDMFGDHIDDVAMELKALIAAVEMGGTTDPEAARVIRQLNRLLERAGQGMEESEAQLAKARRSLANMVDTGDMAMNATDAIQRDILASIRYNNVLAEQSEAALWKHEKYKLINQLKDEHTQNLIREQQKWRDRIQKDRTVREKMNENMHLRKQIHTNVTRLRKLLVNESDQKNVPEHMKSLAREVLTIITNNDLGGRKITGIARQDLIELQRVLGIMNSQDGRFTPGDLKGMNDEGQSIILDALADIEDGITLYNSQTKGRDIMENLDGFHAALESISEGVAAITSVINHEREISLGDRRILVEDAALEIIGDMEKNQRKGELQGAFSRQIKFMDKFVRWGTLSPVYFFKNLHNRGMQQQWQELSRAENRNGLELQKAADFVQSIADKYGYKEWSDQKMTVTIGGRKLNVTAQQIMTLYAIWKREHTTNPEMSNHLAVGGVFFQTEDSTTGRLRREQTDMRPVRITDEDMATLYDMLSDAQKGYIEDMVGYLSNEMSALGNEASMRMYGIKKYKEKYYFPMHVWDGVKSARSDKGITSGKTENRAANKGWQKRRKQKANNALVIGNFTNVAVGHIVEMINYNTVAPAIENLNKVLNFQQLIAGDDTKPGYGNVKRNVRVMFQQAYGTNALNYLETFIDDLNGGTVQDKRKTPKEAALSMFKKNAVAGSLSVAAQQPLSYIRAAMMIKTRYLSKALLSEYWKGSYEERMKYSGVSVIKEMGRFDMGYGSSAREFINPDEKEKIWKKFSDKLNILPEYMDRWTWNRLWVAVKAEQHAEHPEMDIHSDEFLQLVAERFNDVMQKTQVYDSVMVKSQNMRSKNIAMKAVTAFMAEPSLSLNVLADAVQNIKEPGGKQIFARAGATFILEAVCAAIVKGFVGAGRTPDEKKTREENFLYKWWQAIMNEANPIALVPGYSNLIDILKRGEVTDDAMSILGKFKTIQDTINNIANGKSRGGWRDVEDTIGQFLQLVTNVPAKNIMRDARAMYNFFSQEPYAKRETSTAVKNKQREAAIMNADNLLGVLNVWLGEAGFKTTNKAYYGRLFDAMQSGNDAEAQEIREYMSLAKGADESSINSGLKTAAKAKLPAAEASTWMIKNNLMGDSSTLTSQYKKGEITKDEYRKLLKEQNPKLTENDIWWKIDLVDYKNETGDEEASGKGYRLKASIAANSTNDIRAAINDMTKHGIAKDKIKSQYLSKWKSEYLAGDSTTRRRIRDALQKAYKILGYTAEDANKVIDKWKPDKKSSGGSLPTRTMPIPDNPMSERRVKRILGSKDQPAEIRKYGEALGGGPVGQNDNGQNMVDAVNYLSNVADGSMYRTSGEIRDRLSSYEKELSGRNDLANIPLESLMEEIGEITGDKNGEYLTEEASNYIVDLYENDTIDDYTAEDLVNYLRENRIRLFADEEKEEPREIRTDANPRTWTADEFEEGIEYTKGWKWRDLQVQEQILRDTPSRAKEMTLSRWMSIVRRITDNKNPILYFSPKTIEFLEKANGKMEKYTAADLIRYLDGEKMFAD